MSKLRRFEPLASNHPAVGTRCLYCKKKIKGGDVLTLVPVGTDDEEEKKKKLAGRAYNAVARLVHVHCAKRAGLEVDEKEL